MRAAVSVPPLSKTELIDTLCNPLSIGFNHVLPKQILMNVYKDRMFRIIAPVIINMPLC